MANTNIIKYNNSQTDYYQFSLDRILHQIRNLNKINNEFLSGNWDTNIKYRSSFYRNLQELQSKYYQERGKWVDFIFNTEHLSLDNTNINSLLIFSTESLYQRRMRLILLLFWRDIIRKLNINTNFKLQLKIKFSVSIGESNLKHKGTPTIRSIGSVNIHNKQNFYEALSYFEYHLSQHVDEYLTFPVTDVILTYNICLEDSILNKIDLTKRNFNLLVKIDTKNNMKKNKETLKISENFLPLTTDLSKWGTLKIIEGYYPYQIRFKETNLTIETSSNLFNYVVTIKGIFTEGKKVIIHNVKVTDKTFKVIFMSFIDIKTEFSPDFFVRIINNSQYVYKDGIKVLSQKRKKAKYFTSIPKCKRFTYNFITMDLETKAINGNLTPYCVSIYDGKRAYSFYITDYNSSDDLLKASVKFILKRKFNKHRVYLHNFSYFDGIFLMKIISSTLSSNFIKPIIRDGRIINLKVEFYSKSKK